MANVEYRNLFPEAHPIPSPDTNTCLLLSFSAPSMPASESSTVLPEPIVVPFEGVAAFNRKLIHDIRNGLNAIDLQLASMMELDSGSDSALREDLQLARRLLHNEARRLVEIATQFRNPSPQIIGYHAADLVEDMRARIARGLGDAAPAINWTVEAHAERVAVDFEMLSGVVVELARNAAQFRGGADPIEARAAVEDGRFVLEWKQHRDAVDGDPAKWGDAPFTTSRRGAYGLGLFAARRTLAALGGTLRMSHDAERCELSSRLTLPLAT